MQANNKLGAHFHNHNNSNKYTTMSICEKELHLQNELESNKHLDTALGNSSFE
jgi:hypothetical protein